MMNGFKEAYNNLRRKDASDVRNAITEGCKWNNREVFYMKKNGDISITPKEESVISIVFRNKGINALTGAEI